jgi:hypothetical protein
MEIGCLTDREPIDSVRERTPDLLVPDQSQGEDGLADAAHALHRGRATDADNANAAVGRLKDLPPDRDEMVGPLDVVRRKGRDLPIQPPQNGPTAAGLWGGG